MNYRKILKKIIIVISVVMLINISISTKEVSYTNFELCSNYITLDCAEAKSEKKNRRKIYDENEIQIIWGDINFNGIIDIEDAILLKRFVNGITSLEDIHFCVADVNADGVINMDDVRCLNDYIQGKHDINTRIGEIKEIIKLSSESSSFHKELLKKPIIYLYPEERTAIYINLKLDGDITCTYPKMNNGWYVTAEPDGSLTDKKEKHYNYLFWEGVTHKTMDFSTGFCVAGSEVEEFLQDKLSYMGMNEKEINDFMVYWLPQMQDNPYNIISFQKKNYVETAVLDVTPVPDTSIRVFMAWKKSADKVDIKPQQLDKIERKGFTLVEWGGGEVTDKYKENKLE